MSVYASSFGGLKCVALAAAGLTVVFGTLSSRLSTTASQPRRQFDLFGYLSRRPSVMAAQDVSEGDGWEQDFMPGERVLEAAVYGDAQQVRELVQAAGVPFGQIIWSAVQFRSDYAGLEFMFEVCGTAGVNSCSEMGWTPLATAATSCEYEGVEHLRTVELLLSRGANPNQRVVNMTYNDTPLQLIHGPGRVHFPARTRRLVSHLLLRYGAEISPAATDPYLCKVAAAGGFRAYERAHRARLTAPLARVVFPRLPVDVVSHVVAFSFHAGYY